MNFRKHPPKKPSAPREPFKLRARRMWRLTLNWISKPQNVLLVVFGIALSIFVFIPLIQMVIDAFTIHEGTIESELSGEAANSLSLYSWKYLLTGPYAVKTFWEPFGNTMALSVLSCLFAVVFGGVVAFLITRTNMALKKWISAIFIFPYIMPQWTLANVWSNLFESTVYGGRNGVFANLGIIFPEWWAEGLFPSALVLGLHYAPFAYILIGGIFRNMDANLEEAATILNTPKLKTFFRITLPMVKPAILSTVLLVFSSAMGSYPVPHYLNFKTLSTQYMESTVGRPAVGSIISVIMMIIGVAILLVNQRATSGRKQYTTVSGKSGQISKINIGKVGRWVVAAILLILTMMTSIYPIISFALETFLANPGDYSAFTTKWWTWQPQPGSEDVGLYGQAGILHNSYIWTAFGGTVLVATLSALFAGTIGTLVGYCVSKNRKGKFANYVNGVAFLPYLLPSLSVGAAYFVFGNALGMVNTYSLLILVGTIKYIPFASRSSLNSMLQLSGEIEEAAIIQNVPWWKRMLRIIVPIQKTSILSGYLLPFITAMRELTLFMMLADQSKLATLTLSYFDEMGLYAFSSAINLILIIFILAVNGLINKLTGASLDKGIGG